MGRDPAPRFAFIQDSAAAVNEASIDVYSLHRVEEDAFTRSRRGVARPIFYKGEQIGEWRHYDERLTMFLLRARRPQRYGKWIDRMLAPDRDEGQEEPGIRLDGGLEGIEWASMPFTDEEGGNDDGGKADGDPE